MRSPIFSSCSRNPQAYIAYSWFFSIVLVIAAFICACIVANKQATTSALEGSNAIAFASIWTSILLILLSVGGSVIMRKYRTSLVIGIFLGVIVVMSQQMLIMFAIFSGRANDTTNSGEKAADAMFAAFCLFLFIDYTVFAFLLGAFRSDVVTDPTTAMRYNSDLNVAHSAVAV